MPSRLAEIPRSAECCTNCAYYHQHFIFVEIGGLETYGYFTPCYAGHCTRKNSKSRKPDDHCDDFAWERDIKNTEDD